MQRRRPDSWAKYVSTPVVLLGVTYIPPATGINYSAWFAVGFVFQFVIRKRNFAWWSKYNYVTGAALDCGPFSNAAPYCEDVCILTDIWDMNRYYTGDTDNFLYAPAAQRGLFSQLVGQYGLHE
jgi:OPT oligopeptide transporter protein